MFYYRITRVSRKVPRTADRSYEQFGSYAAAGERMAEITASGRHSLITLEVINQAAYIAATRPHE